MKKPEQRCEFIACNELETIGEMHFVEFFYRNELDMLNWDCNGYVDDIKSYWHSYKRELILEDLKHEIDVKQVVVNGKHIGYLLEGYNIEYEYGRRFCDLHGVQTSEEAVERATIMLSGD